MQTAVIGTIALLCCLSASAQSTDTGQSICYEAEKAINGLVDYTKTTCIPSAGKGGAHSFLVISDEPVFSNAASKKGWVIVVVAAIGKAMNSRRAAKGDELWMSDLNQTKNRIAYAISVSLAKSLQRQVYNDEISLDQMYSEIQRNLVRKNTGK